MFMSIGRQSTFSSMSCTTADIHTSRRWSRDEHMADKGVAFANASAAQSSRRASVREAGAGENIPMRVRKGLAIPRMDSAAPVTDSTSQASTSSTSFTPFRTSRTPSLTPSDISVDSATYATYSTASRRSSTYSTSMPSDLPRRRKRDDLWALLSSPETLVMATKILTFMGNSVPQTQPYTSRPFGQGRW